MASPKLLARSGERCVSRLNERLVAFLFPGGAQAEAIHLLSTAEYDPKRIEALHRREPKRWSTRLPQAQAPGVANGDLIRGGLRNGGEDFSHTSVVLQLV